MKKLKIILSSAAIITAVSFAFALREQKPNCTSLPQFYFDGSSFQPAGELGVDYVCQSSSDTCTYIEEGGRYIPCRTGMRITVSLK